MTWSIVLHIVLGLTFLAVGADLLVRGAASLAEHLGIPSLIVGLTVVAFGTSAPEALVTIQGALSGQTGIAVGNVVGSNIFNILVILGLSALFAPLVVSRQVVRFDVPIMIAASFVVFFFARDGAIMRSEGALLLATIVGYTILLIRQVPREALVEAAAGPHGGGPDVSPRPPGDPPMTSPPIPSEQKGRVRSTIRDLVFAGAGVILLVAGARWLVTGSATLARELGVSDLVVGLTVVAVGTSLPELSTSLMAALRGARDIAVGNIVGSNIFNLLLVVGLGSVVAEDGLPISADTLAFDLPVMTVAAAACLPIFFTGYAISRWEGVVFLIYYALYLGLLIMSALAHEAAPVLRVTVVLFVIPLTLLTLMVLTIQTRKSGASRR